MARTPQKGFRRLHEGAYAVVLVVRMLYCLCTNLKGEA